MKLASACLLLASSAAAFVPAQRRAFAAPRPATLSAKAYEADEINSIVSTLPHLDANEKANLKALLFKAGEVNPASTAASMANEDVAVLAADEVSNSQDDQQPVEQVSVKNEEPSISAAEPKEGMRGESSVEIASSESQDSPVAVEDKPSSTVTTSETTTTPEESSSTVSGGETSSLEVAGISDAPSSKAVAEAVVETNKPDQVVASVLPSTTPAASAEAAAAVSPVDAAAVASSGGGDAANLVTDVLFNSPHSEVVEGVVNALSQL